ncbi:F-box and WD domain protein [Drechmeria coniospora]|uniref:F-box and WD domain protein n=1 Tax=Drechmeria coniospora TaxID=98403 RepID=A0A151GR47_DRECN|nr:F-box and WD domain protein [Drechmeria coniospora]KYK59576.1 F-box and WD domain protein [Drechmeria coniospora]
MQREAAESREQGPQIPNDPKSSNLAHDGLLDHLHRVPSLGSGSSRAASPPSIPDDDDLDASRPARKPDELNLGTPRTVFGQRIIDYENALAPPPRPKHARAFDAARHSDPTNAVQLTHLPNEILTHVFSHLHPDSHSSVALVSKRFYALVASPHAWRMAFMRYFPGHTCLGTNAFKVEANASAESPTDHSTSSESESRFFGRLTPLASWRSEYLFRTRLMRNLMRGKPGISHEGVGPAGSRDRSSKKKSAVLTFNSKLPSPITNLDAHLPGDKTMASRAIHGAGELAVATMSNPTSGKMEKWGLQDPFFAALLHETAPNLVPYGLGDGPAACPNRMDVSQAYGMLAGEGFPGGRAYFRAGEKLSGPGRYLAVESTDLAETYPDIPHIPDMLDSISSVWIAKSSAVPATTLSMCGMLTGSALGLVTAFSLGSEANRPVYGDGDMTARWVLSPGVPIVSLKVDDSYSTRRKASARLWAVALNALGEVYYLVDVPKPASMHNRPNVDRTRAANHVWLAGRSASWRLIEGTRRVARHHDSNHAAPASTHSPAWLLNSMERSNDQLAAEVRETERFFHHRPAHFRKLYHGWDMQRKLEVDFAADDGQGAGECILVIDCGLAEGQPARVRRFTRALQPTLLSHGEGNERDPSAGSASTAHASSLFGTQMSDLPPSPKLPFRAAAPLPDDWSCSSLHLNCHAHCTITASDLDRSTCSLLTLSEDPLQVQGEAGTASASSDEANAVAREIPGRRARLFAIGTKAGAVLAWNAREVGGPRGIRPVRVIQTESPEISCVAVSALYLVHGGSDGLAQAWDILASTSDAIRTINPRSNRRVPRHPIAMNPASWDRSHSAVGAIYLDPDATILRGVLSVGAYLRYWTYSSSGDATGRKRRHRHADMHGRIASRRLGETVSGYIAAEAAELRRENEHRAREHSRLRKHFGLGALGDLTEEEALRYAQLVSEESYLRAEQHRAIDSAADASHEMASFVEASTDAATPEPSATTGACLPPDTVADDDGDDDDEADFEQQIQDAIRLSLLDEEVTNAGAFSGGDSSGGFDYAIRVKPKSGRKCKRSSSPDHSPYADHSPITFGKPGSSQPVANEDESLALAIRLSLQYQNVPPSPSPSASSVQDDGALSSNVNAMGMRKREAE